MKEKSTDLRTDQDFVLDELESYMVNEDFRHLFELAWEACLDRPLPSQETTTEEPSLNQRLVLQNGALALRAALELQMGTEKFHPNRLEATEDDPDLVPLSFDTILRRPYLFCDRTRPRIVKQAERFGKALIDESFAVLGEDAAEQIKSMQSSDPEEQLMAIYWLEDRILDLARKKCGEMESDDDEYHYHPMRLSPKLTGMYPNHKLTPTCLMTSILVSSFFEKAGVPYLHAGVAVSRYEQQLKDTANGIDGLVKWYRTPNGGLSPLLADNLEGKSNEVDKRLAEDTGYHAAVYVRLNDDNWTQVDPFFSATGPVPTFAGKKFDQAYDTLKEFETSAPNLELSCNTNILNFQTGLQHVVAECLKDGSIKPEIVKTAIDLILSADESVPQQIYTQVILPQFLRIAHQEEDSVQRYTASQVLAGKSIDRETDTSESLLQSTFYKLFDKYVLWGKPLDEVRQRAQKDEAYLGRRVLDLVYLPAAICMSIALEDTVQNSWRQWMHEGVEVGLPHARIGFSVLSDFASYCDDSLPPSFWSAHWPSLIPITETMRRSENTISQKAVLANLALWLNEKGLTYSKSDAIIEKFLMAREKGNDNDQS